MNLVTIVAFGPSTRTWMREWYVKAEDCGAIWGINNVHAVATEGLLVDAVVAMDDLKRDLVEHPEYVDQIVSCGRPVITSTAYPEWPMTEAYPLKEVIAALGLGTRAQKVLSNTCCYALALAMMREFNEIVLVGYDFVKPDLATDFFRAKKKLKPHQPEWFIYYADPFIRAPTEPGLDGINYLIGLADARGIRVAIPYGSTLLDYDRPDFFYGYQVQPEL